MTTPQSCQSHGPSGDDHIDEEPLGEDDAADGTFCDDTDFMYFDDDNSDNEYTDEDELPAEDDDYDTRDDEHDKSRRRDKGRRILSPWLMMGLLFEEEDL